MGDRGKRDLLRTHVLALAAVHTRRTHVHQSRKVEHRVRRHCVFRHHELLLRKAFNTRAYRAHVDTLPTAITLIKLGEESLELVLAVKLGKLRRHGFACHLHHDAVQLLA